MSILNHLVFQPIDDDLADQIPKEHQHDSDDDIKLRQDVDESELDRYWDGVVRDIQHDPNWFSLNDDESDADHD